jgi:hypothetical protein
MYSIDDYFSMEGEFDVQANFAFPEFNVIFILN